MSIGMMRTNVGAKARLNRITITSWQKVDIPKGGRNRIQRKRKFATLGER